MGAHYRKFESAKILTKNVLDRYSIDQVSSLSAALAYYTVFSLAPILIIAIGIAGLVLHGDSVRADIFDQIQNLIGQKGARAAESLLSNFSRQKGSNIGATVVGGVVLIFGASSVFSQLQTSLNIIWRVPYKKVSGFKNIVRQRLLTFAMVLGVGFLMTVSLLVSALLSGVVKYASGYLSGSAFFWQAVNFLVGLVVIMFLFALIFKFIPDAKVKWRHVWPGALLTAFLFSIGKTLIGLYLGKSSVASAYGAAGSVVVLLLWVYYASQILYIGAEFTFSYGEFIEKGRAPVTSQPQTPMTFGKGQTPLPT